MDDDVAPATAPPGRRRRGPGRRWPRRRPPPITRSAMAASNPSPSSSRRRSKQSFFRISLVARCMGVARRPGRMRRTTWLSGTLRRMRSTRAVPRNPVAPVMKKRLPARASRTRVTRSVYHMVSDGVDHRTGCRGARDRSRPRPVPAGGRTDADGATTSERILDAALASFATRGYEASSLDAPGRRPRHPQADHPLLVPEQGGPARGGHRPQCHRTVGRPRGLAGLGRHRMGPGRGGGQVGLPPGRPPARAAGPGAGDGPARALRRPPASSPPSSRWCSGPPGSWRRRWTPGTCGATTPGCCCWPSTRRSSGC